MRQGPGLLYPPFGGAYCGLPKVAGYFELPTSAGLPNADVLPLADAADGGSLVNLFLPRCHVTAPGAECGKMTSVVCACFSDVTITLSPNNSSRARISTDASLSTPVVLINQTFWASSSHSEATIFKPGLSESDQKLPSFSTHPLLACTPGMPGAATSFSNWPARVASSRPVAS